MAVGSNPLFIFTLIGARNCTFLSFFIHCAVVFHCFLLSFFSREFRTESRDFLSERFKLFCARCWNCFTTCRLLQRYKLSSSKRNYVNSWMWRWSGSDVTCKKSHSIAKNIFGLKGAQKKITTRLSGKKIHLSARIMLA